MRQWLGIMLGPLVLACASWAMAGSPALTDGGIDPGKLARLVDQGRSRARAWLDLDGGRPVMVDIQLHFRVAKRI